MENKSSFSLSQIEQIAQPVKDLERAVGFYRTQLGMKFLFISNGLAFFDCSGVRLLLSKPESADFDHPGSVLYFKVGDIHQAHQELLDRGVSFIDSPHIIANMGAYDLWMAFFNDSEGNMLAISGDIPHP
jgi:predicted enzyme related to lactoylglutathione lyase